MSVGFRAVQWNRAKLVYDAIVLVAIALYLGGFHHHCILRSIRPGT